MDYAVLQLLNHDHGPTYVTAQLAAAGAPTMMVDAGQEAPAVIYQAEESHFWRNFFLGIGGLIVVVGAVAAFVHWLELDEN